LRVASSGETGLQACSNVRYPSTMSVPAADEPRGPLLLYGGFCEAVACPCQWCCGRSWTGAQDGPPRLLRPGAAEQACAHLLHDAHDVHASDAPRPNAPRPNAPAGRTPGDDPTVWLPAFRYRNPPPPGSVPQVMYAIVCACPFPGTRVCACAYSFDGDLMCAGQSGPG